MKQQHIRFSIAALVAAMCAPAAHAVDVTAGDWKLSFDGNVNADYIYSNCESLDNAKTIGGGLTCVAPGDGQRSSSSVSNGLLPAALSISAASRKPSPHFRKPLSYLPAWPISEISAMPTR